MGIDHPDNADVPPDKHSDHPPHRAQAETRYRQDYYADLRTAVAVEERTEPAGRYEPAGAQTENNKQAQPGTTWEETAELSRWIWTEYKRRWPPEERPPVGPSSDPPGSWRGDSNRFLDRAANERIEAEYDRIAAREQEKISPALRATESQDPDRHLIGFEHRLKDHDRIKEKVYGTIKDHNRSAEKAVSLVRDAIRYTFQYDEARYTQGVQADITRLKDQGLHWTKSRILDLTTSTRGSTASGSSRRLVSGSKCSFTLALASKQSRSHTPPTHGSGRAAR